MQKLLTMLLLSAFVAMSAIGCAGRTANPIATKEVGDRDLDCEEIEAEMSDLDAQARRLLGEQDSKTGKNVAIGVAGLFIWPIWFFADLSTAERQEAQAMQDRARHLQRLARKKDCDF